MLNGAGMRLSVTAAGDKGVLFAREWRAPGRASKYMSPAVADALKFLNIGPGELGGLAVVRGPGSFTGLRLTLAFALGFSRSANVPLAGIDHLPLLASGPGPLLDGTLAVAVHSRTREIYVQAFACPGLEPLAAPAVFHVEALPAMLADLPRPVRLMGGGPRNLADFSAALPGHVCYLPPDWDEPSPELLARAALAAKYGPDMPEPLYLRPSDAEENLAGFAASRGLGAEEAGRRLVNAMRKSP